MGEPFLWCLWLIEGTPESQRVVPRDFPSFSPKRKLFREKLLERLMEIKKPGDWGLREAQRGL